MDYTTSKEAAEHFIRSRAEWEQALRDAEDFDDRYSLACDLSLDPQLKQSDVHMLLKLAAKLNGVSLKALKADIAGDLAEDDAQKDDLAFARETIEQYGDGNLLYAPGGFWAWKDSGVWQLIERHEVARTAQRVLDGQTKVSASLVNSVVTLAQNELYQGGTRFDDPADRRINVQNGTLEYSDGAWALREHRREDYLTTQLPVAYDADAKCPRFKQYLAEVFEGDEDAEDKGRVVLEMLGYTLLQSCRFEKFVILVGGGSNGKSVLLELLRALVGPGQYSAVDPGKLGDRFQRGHIRGKLANICPELAVGAMLADDKMKAFTSGDLINGEHKGRDPFDFVPFATFWTGTNHMPHTRDLSHGMARRALILKFNRQFGESEREIGLADKLKGELPGILAAAVRAVAEVFARGAFTEPASSREALKAWRKDSDQVAQFAEDECRFEIGLGPVSREELFGRFLDWAQRQNIKHSVNSTNFTTRLEALGAIPCRPRIGGKQVRGFLGIDFAPDR